MNHARQAAVTTVLVTVLAAACTSPQLGPELDDPGADDPPTDDPAPDPDEDAAPDPDEDAAPESGPDESDPEPCDDKIRAAIDEAIAGQLAAFADDDFAAALDFASEGFRAGIDPGAFQMLIEDRYPVAADAADHVPGECLRSGPDAAEVRVEVTADDGTRGELVYLMVDEDDQWRIAGAVELEPDDDAATAV
jgi:hypothetical protein